MWDLVRRLRENGTTIILTTHYIEEAEEMADRVGVINKGELILVEEKNALMQKLGRKVLHLQLTEPLDRRARLRWPNGSRGSATTATCSPMNSTPRPSAPASRRCCRRCATPESASRTSTPSNRAWRTFSSA